ncbi:MAG: hypothetical protein R6U68_17180 [Desulfobacteraceae bacterium]
MADRFMSMDNLVFTLNSRSSRYRSKEVLSSYPLKTLDMVLKAALDIANKLMHPMFEEMDRTPPVFVKGQVKVHPGVRPMLEILGRDGWISAPFPEEWEGENMPASILHCINFIFSSANYSAAVYSGLTTGAARLLLSFGSRDLQQWSLPGSG